jgi:branched-chain amino acid transport system permease protein
VLLVPLQQLLNSQLSAYPAGFNLVIYALVVLVILWVEPRGLMSLRRRASGGGLAQAAGRASPPSAAAPQTAGAPVTRDGSAG